MFKGLMGSSWLGGGFDTRRMATLVDRADFWTGTAIRTEADVDPAAPARDGLIAGTMVATERGWQRVEDLQPGDLVVTFDHGLRPVRALSRATLSTRTGTLPRAAQPLTVPAGALGNRRALTLMPGQAVLIESDRAEDLYGDPFVLVPAAALDGWKGIARTQPQPEATVIFLEFDGDEIVYAEGMALVQCGRRQPALVSTADELMAAGQPGSYPVLTPGLGRALINATPAR